MSFLEDFQTDLELLPALLHRTYGTMRNLDNSLQALLQQNEQRCIQEILDLKQEIESGNVKPDKSLVKFSDDALDEQKHCIRIADEKVTLASQAYDVVDGQIQKLDQFMRKLDQLKQVKESGTAAAGTSSLNTESSTRSGRGTENSRRKKTRLAEETPSVNLDLPVDPNEPTYCFCNQVSYGEMVACDNPQCTIEWFHFGCVGLKEQPKGKWYCSNCVGSQKHRKGK